MSAKRLLLMAAVLSSTTSLFAAGKVDEVVGTWRGTSLCTPVRPACHDEIAVYHATASSKPDTIVMKMNKVVDGKEVEMGPGTVDFHVDYPTRTLTWEMTARDGHKGLWTLTWTGKKMTGTLIQLPGREVVRNIAVEKQ